MPITKSKIVHTELKGNLSKQFEIIKFPLGIQNDAEMIRFLIQQSHREHLEGKELSAQKELAQNKSLINKFMKKYSVEWRKLSED